MNTSEVFSVLIDNYKDICSLLISNGKNVQDYRDIFNKQEIIFDQIKNIIENDTTNLQEIYKLGLTFIALSTMIEETLYVNTEEIILH